MENIIARELNTEKSSYKIISKIGQGGMSSVYKARDTKSGKFVAVKVLALSSLMDSNMLVRFRREIRLVMEHRHPHIVPILDFGEEEQVIFLVMPIFEGGNLAQKLKSGKFSPQDGMKVIDQISKALQFIHVKGVVHRDVKPANILYDLKGDAYLADFGLASHKEASISLTGSALIGTPAYMAPEQATSTKSTSHTDQYAMGITLFLMLTGKLPFKADSPIGTIFKHINEPLPSIREIKPNIPFVLERVVRKATDKDPHKRFDSMTALNNAFQAAMKHTLDPNTFPEPEISVTALDTIELQIDALDETGTHPPLTRRPLLIAVSIFTAIVLVVGALFINNQRSSLGVNETQTVEPALLTQMVSDLDQMSTEGTANNGQGLSEDEIKTAVIQTLDAMDTPALTATPEPSSQITLSLVKKEQTQTQIHTPGQESSTPELGEGQVSATPGSTNAFSPTPTFTLIKTYVFTKTITQTNPAINTPTWTQAATKTSTRTQAATPTQTQTLEPSKTSTNTLVPTRTDASEEICGKMGLTPHNLSDNLIQWQVTNNSGQFTSIIRIYLSFPVDNNDLQVISFENLRIWSGSSGSPVLINSGWSGTIVRREILDGRSKILEFLFEETDASAGYSLQVSFGNGCTLSSDR